MTHQELELNIVTLMCLKKMLEIIWHSIGKDEPRDGGQYDIRRLIHQWYITDQTLKKYMEFAKELGKE